MENITELAMSIRQANKIAVLTGAGISVESGIPDFRTSQGAFWLSDAERMKYMSSDYRDGKPKEFWPKFKEIFNIKIENKFYPNYSHMFLKELEDMGKDIKIITQNVDGLHQDAGSSAVYEMHGTMKYAICPKCKTKYGAEHVTAMRVPRCTKINGKGNVCNFILKPDVVLFGDPVHYYKEAEKAIEECDLLLVLGTSLKVPPVSYLPLLAERKRKEMAIINLHPTDYDSIFDIVIHGGLVDTLKQIKDNI